MFNLLWVVFLLCLAYGELFGVMVVAFVNSVGIMRLWWLSLRVCYFVDLVCCWLLGGCRLLVWFACICVCVVCFSLCYGIVVCCGLLGVGLRVFRATWLAGVNLAAVAWCCLMFCCRVACDSGVEL